ncbi:MAG TPA: hypothetical protein VGK19_09445 [Capsulimonadaceae bacterium]|jgi:hypothetical protein
MTLTLELTSEQETKLRDKAAKIGLDPEGYILQIIDDVPTVESSAKRLQRLGILGGVAGNPRQDGRPWSEIEGFE